MVKTFQVYLSKNKCTYSCIHCRAHLADHDDLISKSFQGSQGRAYLFNKVVNVTTGPAEERYLLTGLHAVADIYCESCKTTIGWKYEQAFESSQKYKEGKFIIELIHLIKDNGWDTESIFNKLNLNLNNNNNNNGNSGSDSIKINKSNSKKANNSNNFFASSQPTTSGLLNHHHHPTTLSSSSSSSGSGSSSSASSSTSTSPTSSASTSPTSNNSAYW